MIKEKFIQDLSEEQKNIAVNFLETAFIKREKMVSDLKTTELQIIYKVYKAVEIKTRHVMLSILAQNTLEKFATLMNATELIELFVFHSELEWLQNIFKALPYPSQAEILRALQTQDSLKFTALEKLTSEKMGLASNIVLQKAAITPALIENETQRVLDIIQQKKFTPTDAIALSHKLEKQYEPKYFETICINVLEAFQKLNLPLKDQNSFSGHLKFLFYLEPALKRFSGFKSRLQNLRDKHITSLAVLPNNEWVAKILNQYPIFMIKEIFIELSTMPNLKNLDKKQKYTKILQCIKESLDQTKYPNMYTAYKETFK